MLTIEEMRKLELPFEVIDKYGCVETVLFIGSNTVVYRTSDKCEYPISIKSYMKTQPKLKPKTTVVEFNRFFNVYSGSLSGMYHRKQDALSAAGLNITETLSIKLKYEKNEETGKLTRISAEIA